MDTMGRLLRRLIEGDKVPSMIFWGPPGCGKTTLGHIIAKKTGAQFVFFSAVLSGKADVRRVVEEAHQAAKDILSENRDGLDRISRILLERETIGANEFGALLDGASEEEVFGAEEAEGSDSVPEEPEPESEKGSGREGARPSPRPRPGFAGGAAEMRSD